MNHEVHKVAEVPLMESRLCQVFQLGSRDESYLYTNTTGSNATGGDYKEPAPTGPEDTNNWNEWFEIVIPVICVFGVIGNLLNLIVMTRQRLLSRMDRLEKAATYGLIALAFSDMLFCALVFPHCFVTERGKAAEAQYVYQLYYRLYGVGLINMFLMNSTWLVVYMAISRLIVVTYPFQARSSFSAGRCAISIVLIYFFSAISTLPFLIHIIIQECWSPDGTRMYEFYSPWARDMSNPLKFYITWVWPVLADYIPLLILAIINVRLIKELKSAKTRRRRSCRGQIMRDNNQKVTLTLVIIVLMLFFLVTPSEILRYVNPYKLWGNKVGHLIVAITNVLQTINFAFNFVLYCVVSPSFRQTVRSIIICCEEQKQSLYDLSAVMLTPVSSFRNRNKQNGVSDSCRGSLRVSNQKYSTTLQSVQRKSTQEAKQLIGHETGV